MEMPIYNDEEVDKNNRFICDEMRYNRHALALEHQQLIEKLTNEQKSVYKKIIASVNENKGGFFLYGFDRIEKSFIWKILSTFMRSKGDIVLTVASRGIASLLLPGRRTAHSRFVISLNITEDSTCNIQQGTPLANLIIKTKLIIWDEAPMMHKYYFEALDKILRDILSFKDSSNSQRPFGGKTIVLGRDFRQILPVIPKGTRQDIVNATLNSSYLWPHCQLLRLTKNMRLQGNEIGTHLDELRDFLNWILTVGDSRIESLFDRIKKVPIPNNLLVKESINPISAIVESTYPDFINHYNDLGYLQQRVILAPTLDMVESSINI
ncbi:hypothetical protein P3S67_025976 [Capsicum chacoense]